MKKSTRALVGLVALDGILAAGAWWMVMQVKSGAWNAPDPAEAITRILTRDPLSLLKLCPTLDPEIAAVVDKGTTHEEK